MGRRGDGAHAFRSPCTGSLAGVAPGSPSEGGRGGGKASDSGAARGSYTRGQASLPGLVSVGDCVRLPDCKHSRSRSKTHQAIGSVSFLNT